MDGTAEVDRRKEGSGSSAPQKPQRLLCQDRVVCIPGPNVLCYLEENILFESTRFGNARDFENCTLNLSIIYQD